MSAPRELALTGTVTLEPGARSVRVGVNLRGVFCDTGEGWAMIPWSRIAAFAALDPEAMSGPGEGADLNAAVAAEESRRSDTQPALPGVAMEPAAEPQPAPAAAPGEASRAKRRQRCPGCKALTAERRNALCPGCVEAGVDPRTVHAKVGSLSEALGAS